MSRRPLVWIGPSKRDLLTFPRPVIASVGQALGVAQIGGKSPAAKPWKGQGPGVFEIVEDYDGDTYRAVYTVRFTDAIYVLHAFQKKSTRGIKTAATDVALITARLKTARTEHERMRRQ